MTKHIPNFITCLNLFFGSVAVMLAFSDANYLPYVSMLIIFAAIFDFADGFAARALKAYSPMGKELDSLADLISFGLAPTAIIFQFMKIAIMQEPATDSQLDALIGLLYLMSPFLIVIFSGLRLAKFNVDTRQTESFIGMPTPANAMMILSIPLILAYNYAPIYKDIVINKHFLLVLTLVQSFFLVSEIPMFSLKFKNLSVADNKLRFAFLISSCVFITIFQFAAIPLIILFYVLLSLVSAICPCK